jgi:PAS domain S-box-containing protein
MGNARKGSKGRRTVVAVPRKTAPLRKTGASSSGDARYAELIHGLPLGVWRTNPEGKIILANSSLTEMLGFPSYEAFAERGIKPDSYTGYPRMEFREKLAREGQIKALETTWLKADNTPINVRENARAVRKHNGEVQFYEGTVEDITNQKQTEEELRVKAEFLEEVITNAAVGIIVIDENNKYVLLNPESGRIVGHWPDDWTGKEAGMNVHPEDQGRALSNFIQAVSGEPAGCELRIMATDGKYKHVTVHLSPLTLMGSPHVLGIVHDITKRKELEERTLASKTRGMLEISMIAMSVFLKGIPPAELEGLMGNFQKLLEKYMRPVFDDDMEQMLLAESEPAITTDATDRLVKRYLTWLSEIHVRFGMPCESSKVGNLARLDKLSCKWLDAAKVNPVFCRICEIVTKSSFEWSGLKGRAEQKSTIAGGAIRCNYIFDIQRQ